MDLLQLKIYTHFFFVFLDIGNYSKNVLSAAMTILNILYIFFIYLFCLEIVTMSSIETNPGCEYCKFAHLVHDYKQSVWAILLLTHTHYPAVSTESIDQGHSSIGPDRQIADAKRKETSALSFSL